MGALRALMKPHEWTRGAVEHRAAEQPWPADAVETVRQTTAAVAERLRIDGPPETHLPDGGDFWLVIEFPDEQVDLARALAVALSTKLPGLWLTLDRLYVRDGRFFRRKRDNTFKFRIVAATNVHLPREVRAELRGLI